MHTSDDALLAGMATGDADAAAAFVRRFQGRVYGLAATVLHDRGTAEDVAQEAFVRAWRAAASYDPRRGSVLTWLLAITRHAAIDQLRLRAAEPVDPEVLMRNLGVESGAQETFGERDRVRAGLAQLPPEQRRALFLAAFYGRTAAEISQAEGIPLGTAKTRIRTAMLRLRAELEVEG